MTGKSLSHFKQAKCELTGAVADLSYALTFGLIYPTKLVYSNRQHYLLYMYQAVHLTIYFIVRYKLAKEHSQSDVGRFV